MIRARIRYALPLLAAALFVVFSLHAQDDTSGRGRKYKAPPPTCKISVTVLKITDGKPIEDAAVVFHPIDKAGKDQGNLELKTNEDGKAVISVIPIGNTVRVQVIADGYQTYGNSYELPTDTKDIVIKLHRPGRQYSTYENHPDQGSQNQDQNNQQGSQPPQKPQQ
jgi:hypothetical protein